MVSCLTKEQETPYLHYGGLWKGLVRNKKMPMFVSLTYSKAFDKVKHKLLVDLLQSLAVDQAELRLLTSLYRNQTAAVRCDDHISEWMSIKQGVRQGCVASLHLFALYTEMIMR